MGTDFLTDFDIKRLIFINGKPHIIFEQLKNDLECQKLSRS